MLAYIYSYCTWSQAPKRAHKDGMKREGRNGDDSHKSKKKKSVWSCCSQNFQSGVEDNSYSFVYHQFRVVFLRYGLQFQFRYEFGESSLCWFSRHIFGLSLRSQQLQIFLCKLLHQNTLMQTINVYDSNNFSQILLKKKKLYHIILHIW